MVQASGVWVVELTMCKWVLMFIGRVVAKVARKAVVTKVER